MVGGVCGRRGVRWSRKLNCGLLNIPVAVPSSFSGRKLEMRKNNKWKGEKNAEFEVTC